MVKISVKIHRIRGETILAACDVDVLGNEYVEGEYCFLVSRDFYHDGFVEDSVFKELLSQSTIINLIGESVVELAIKEGFINPEHIFRVANVPHAQSLRIISH